MLHLNDSLGNLIEYTLDNLGNRVAEARYDPQDVLTQTRTMVFDGLNRLQQQVGGSNPRETAAMLARPNLAVPSMASAAIVHPACHGESTHCDSLKKGS